MTSKQPNQTVILVHGTFSSPQPGKRQWYDRTGVFAEKLNAALAQHGCPARCWAHLADHDEIFSWTGENQWSARVEAATSLTTYIARLQNAGWTCHVVAHSHGGNIVLDALPSIARATQHAGGVNGALITLGTPFIDTSTPFDESKHRRSRRYLVQTLIAIISAAGFLAHTYSSEYYSPITSFEDFFDFLISDPYPQYVYGVAGLFLAGLAVWSLCSYFVKQPDLDFWRKAAQSRDKFIRCIHSRYDEAWQLLHHLRSMPDPLKPRSSLAALYADARSAFKNRAKLIDALEGQTSFRAVSGFRKIIVVTISLMAAALFSFGLYNAFALITLNPQDQLITYQGSAGSEDYCYWKAMLHLPERTKLSKDALDEAALAVAHDSVACLIGLQGAAHRGKISPDFANWSSRSGKASYQKWQKTTSRSLLASSATYVAAACVLVANLSPFASGTYYSAVLSPLRALIRYFQAFFLFPGVAANFFVRRRAWSLLQRIAFGLEGYPHEIPQPQDIPARVPTSLIYSQSLGASATERALQRREEWLLRNFGNLSTTLSNLVLNASDLTTLQQSIETDPSLVHSAYYLDDETITHIADWIATRTLATL